MIDTVSYNNAVTSRISSTDETPSKELGKDDFMNLMIKQYQNQNPLEPMEDTEMIAQMAQFSSLEQMKNVAQAVAMLALSQTAATNASMVSLVGKRVLTEGNQFTLNGGRPVDVSFNLPEDSPTAGKMVIRNQAGLTVAEIPADGWTSGSNKVLVDREALGLELPDGLYSYELVDAQGKTISNAQTISNLLVDSVGYEGGSVTLLAGGSEVAIADVLAVSQQL